MIEWLGIHSRYNIFLCSKENSKSCRRNFFNKSFGIYRRRICFLFLIVMFLPLPIFAGGGKDTNKPSGTLPSEGLSSQQPSETLPPIDDRIIPDTGPQPVFEDGTSDEEIPLNETTEDPTDEAEEVSPDETSEIPADETLEAPADEEPAIAVELTQEEAAKAEALKVTEMDIRTSTLTELADWCRSLGLSEGGSKQDLDQRLRNHYGIVAANVSDPLANGEKGARKTIVIESARSTEYFTLEVVDEDYARLAGNVVISLKDEDAVHRIQAWEIIYNRTRNTMTAKGGVEYHKESGDSLETFKGDSLTINLDTFAGVFTGGASERSMADDVVDDKETTAYRFEGSVISRSGDEVTVLQDAVVSNAKNEKNYWSINASKIWLLPGSDFAIFNAVLKVGEIPLLYIPFFFLPADEIVFHPVIGMRPREGYFFQTTTYILGRPKASETSELSITSILGSSGDMEKTRNGLFLRSTGKKARDPNDTRLSILFDAYANLGFYLGTEFELPKIGILDNLNLSAGMGFTRDIYEAAPAWYTPFAPNFDGSSSWNSSKIFSETIPFRYRLKTSGKISGTAGNFSWELPFYSDPYTEKDFMNRSEELDIASLLDANNDTQDDLNDKIINSYEIRLSGSSNPKINALNPYISRISLSNINSFITIRTRNAPDYTTSVSPQRVFYYPDKFTIISANASIGGTPFTFGNVTSNNNTDNQTDDKVTDDVLRSFGVPRAPWEIISEDEEKKQTKSFDQLVPPALKQTFTIPSSANWPALTLDYNLNPNGAIEMQFNSSAGHWVRAEDVRLEDVSSVLSIAKLSGNINFTAKDPLNYYTTTIGFSGDSSWRGYSYINEASSEFDSQEEIDKSNETNYRSSFFTTSLEFSNTIRPFPQHAIWGNSNVKYTLKNLLVKNEFSGTAADPDWKIIAPSWDKNGIATHKLTTNLAANIFDKSQSFVFDADLPPRDAVFTTTANLRFWYTETYINGKIRDPFENSPVFDPYTFTETFRFNTEDYLRYSMVYHPQDDQITSISAGLGFKGFTASFTAEYLIPYFFDSSDPNNIGWKLSGDKKSLEPKDFSLGYNKIFKKEKLWKNRFSFSIDIGTNIKFDLQRYTNSSLNFDLGITFSIKDVLDVSFKAKSANSVMYRYFPSLFSLPVDVPGEKNMFVDLINSFRFDNESLRKSSGFKLRELSVELTHYMGDWNMNLNINLAPYLNMNTSVPSYQFNTEVSFLVTWIPISLIKSEIKYDKDNFKIR